MAGPGLPRVVLRCAAMRSSVARFAQRCIDVRLGCFGPLDGLQLQATEGWGCPPESNPSIGGRWALRKRAERLGFNPSRDERFDMAWRGSPVLDQLVPVLDAPK